MWSAAFSPDGTQIVTTDDKSAQIWDGQTYQRRFVLPHNTEVYQAVYSHDGARLVTAAEDAVRIWDPATGALLHELKQAPNPGVPTDFFVAAISPDGKTLAACDAALACLEIVDSVWSGYRFTLEDNTADGSSAAWVAVGPPLPVSDLAVLPVELSVDGEVVERGTGAAASGHPALGVVWLAEQLARRGQALEPGDLVITGGLTSAHPLEPGHSISASFGDGRWLAEVHRAGLRSSYRTGEEDS